jgi:predicted cupin superfamily sugar epimerase
MSMTPDKIISTLGLSPHPEGGHYLETWRDVREDGTRGSGSAIYYLLCAGERSRRHRIDAVEIWHHYAGDPLELVIDGQAHVLGKDHLDGERPQLIVPPLAWQSACPLGDWTLVGCTVSPAFDFEHFEMD